MPIGIDPKVDFAFKLVFGSPDHTNITTHFLNAVLQWRDPITEVEILNPMQGKAVSADRIDQSPPMEKWLYFLQHAEHLEPGELAARLGDAAYLDAVGVLEMISRSPEDRQFYDARQKFIHDEEGRLLAARQEGREEGREEGLERGREEGLEKGALAGKIQLLQQVLGEPEHSTEALTGQSIRELSSLLDELQRRLRERGI